jgi:hypothetical protein
MSGDFNQADTDWLEGLKPSDWMLDGRPVRGHALTMFDDLDWTKAWVDAGPSPAGNSGPYWHVPLKSGDTTHRLYPKLLGTKWAPLVRRAIDETVEKAQRHYTASKRRKRK